MNDRALCRGIRKATSSLVDRFCDATMHSAYQIPTAGRYKIVERSTDDRSKSDRVELASEAERKAAATEYKRDVVFVARVTLDRPSLKVDEREVMFTPGMAVSAEILTSKRRATEFFLDPIRRTASEGLPEQSL